MQIRTYYKPMGYWKKRIERCVESSTLLQYSKDTYKVIHSIALRMGLKPRSIGYGKWKMRFD